MRKTNMDKTTNQDNTQIDNTTLLSPEAGSPKHGTRWAGHKVPRRESLTKLKATLSCEVKC